METKHTISGFIRNLQEQVKDVYKEVAETPEHNFHFRLGRKLCEELGYPKDELDGVPAQAVGFTSKAAMGATKTYGVKSISVLAIKN